jgi:hypothetical protein
MTLSMDQVRAIQDGEAVPVVPPEVGEECILLRKDVYDRVRSVIEQDDLPSPRAIAGLVRVTLDEDQFDDYGDCKR